MVNRGEDKKPWIERTLSRIAPTIALKREISRRRLSRLEEFKPRNNFIERSFDAVSGDRLRYDFLTTSYDADNAISLQPGAAALRAHVRQLEYNNGFIAGPIKRVVNHVVGTGIRFQARLREDQDQLFTPITQAFAEEFNRTAESLFHTWAIKWADKCLISNFYEIQKVAEAALVRDGEVLVIGRSSGRRDRIIPFCLELLEIDRLLTPSEEMMNPKVRNGIRFDEEGAPQSYFILKEHPGQTLPVYRGQDFEEVPVWNPNGTRKVLHLFNPWRPEQTRGFTDFAAGLKDLQDLDRYTEAEKFAALEDACMTGIVHSPAPDKFAGNYGTETDTQANKIHEFGVGKWHYLNPGEEAEIHKPTRPNAAFGEMMTQLLRGPANATDIPPEIMMQNWYGMNYSNARVVLLVWYLTVRIRQAYLISHFCRPVWENVATDLVGVGKLSAPGFDSRKDAYFSSIWIPPGFEWVDPVKEAQGKAIELENLMDNLRNIAAAKGQDCDENLETIALVLKKIKELEAKYGVKFPTPSKSGQGQAVADGGPAPKEENPYAVSE
jgi:lambda family phage portal protein